MDLKELQLSHLIAEDRPSKVGEIAEILRSWSGPMDEQLVRDLGNFLNPDKKSRWGAPQKEHNPFRDDMLMLHYFDVLKHGDSDPIKTIASAWGLKISPKGRCKIFEQVRARFNSKVVKEYRLYLDRTRDTPAQIIAFLKDLRGIPDDYWNNNILKRL